MAIKFLIDSSSDINEKEAKELGVTMLPMFIGFGEEEYYDGVTLLPDQFYEKLVNSSVHPKTSQVNAFRFEEAFQELTANGDEVIAIVLSSELSATYKSACLAAADFDGKVHVVDSLSATAGIRVLLEYALELYAKGMDAKSIIAELEVVKSKIKIIAVLDTLEYLKKGGRISAATAVVASALSIKPIIGVVDGKVEVIAKAVGAKRGELMLTSLVEKTSGIDLEKPHCMVYSGADDYSVLKYLNNNKTLFGGDVSNVKHHIIGSTIGVHVGPGVVGIVFVEK